MEIARNLRDERGGGDIITVDSGAEEEMHQSERTVRNFASFTVTAPWVNFIPYAYYIYHLVV